MRNLPEMRNILIIILFFFVLPTFGQLGKGIVNVAFDENTRIDFYSDTLTSIPEKQIQFFLDESIKGYNIRDLKKQKEWLKPQAMWFDYDFFFFRCIHQTENFYKVVVNNQTGMTYWIKKADFLSFQDWEQLLIGVLTISRNNDQSIKAKPDSDSQTIDFEADDCFHVIKMQGDWIEITTNGTCTEFEMTSGKLDSGWIKWREDDNLLIEYFLAM